MLSEAQIAALIAVAARARLCAHAPYSAYAVGAAVVTDDERVFVGCNVENASYGLTLCAERAAVAAAVAGGARAIRAAVVVTEGGDPQAPCGACRQWLAELGTPDTEVIASATTGVFRRYTLGELLPEPFALEGAGAAPDGAGAAHGRGGRHKGGGPTRR